MSRITKAELEARVAELELTLETERLARHIEESERAAPAQPEVDDSIIAFVKRQYRANGPALLNVRFVDEPVGGCALARALGCNLNWIAPEPRQDRQGRWWTNVITVEDAKEASSQQYFDRTLPPVEAYEDA